MPNALKMLGLAVDLLLRWKLWLVGTRLPGADKPRMNRLAAGDAAGLLSLIADLRARATAKLGQAVAVACCFEAGRDGLWLHRVLSAHDIDSHVVEPPASW